MSVVVTTSFMASPTSAAGINQSCKKAGATSTAKSKGKTVKVKCTKVGKKLRWVQVGASTSTPSTLKETVSQANARKSAESYIRFQAFSRQGLIKQLEFEKFSTADATYAVDAIKANWNDQAAKSAKSYLEFQSFSRQGLIDQLLFEGFTQAQAEFGVGKTGL